MFLFSDSIITRSRGARSSGRSMKFLGETRKAKIITLQIVNLTNQVILCFSTYLLYLHIQTKFIISFALVCELYLKVLLLKWVLEQNLELYKC